MSRLLKSILLFVAIVIALLAAPLLFISDEGKPVQQPAEGLPWQIELLAEGRTRVFGLSPGSSTLDDARARFGPDAQIAMIIAKGETGSIEAYYESLTAGFVTGKMILTLETTIEQREAMLKRAIKAEFMESTTRRITLAESDLQSLTQAKISALAFIPSANLSEEVVLQRFGPPAERVRSSEHAEHFLYPAKGLDLRLDAKGKELLQYVAPSEFSRLRDPLLAAAKQGA
ncbi:MAG: hypothetical protein AB1443_11020 [Pseudomonadota bacterium]